MLISALGSVEGKPNKLDLAPRQSMCILLVDGLGYYNLADAAGHARFLNSQQIEKSYCYFPATTSTSLTSFATGKKPNATGFIGYNIFNRITGQRMNLLSGWEDQESAFTFQRQPTVSELAVESNVSVDVVSHSTYENTGLTAATMPAANFHSADSIEARFDIALKLLATGDKRVVYLYIQELDQTAHGLGVSSNRWLEGVELLDGLVRDFVERLPKNSGLIVTSDHGVIDVTEYEKIYFDELLPAEEMLFVGGDTRGLMVYLQDPGKTTAYLRELAQELGDLCYLVTAEQLMAAGYFESLDDRPEIVPDFWIIAKKNVALYHRAYARPKSLFNVGHHGAISERELAIPLIRFNC